MGDELQFHLLPIRDWNLFPDSMQDKNERELQFHLLPIRDWNCSMVIICSVWSDCNFTYSLLGIETFNVFIVGNGVWKLQFHLLPIRDWNKTDKPTKFLSLWDCNFTYSLLGIETRRNAKWA